MTFSLVFLNNGSHAQINDKTMKIDTGKIERSAQFDHPQEFNQSVTEFLLPEEYLVELERQFGSSKFSRFLKSLQVT